MVVHSYRRKISYSTAQQQSHRYQCVIIYIRTTLIKKKKDDDKKSRLHPASAPPFPPRGRHHSVRKERRRSVPDVLVELLPPLPRLLSQTPPRIPQLGELRCCTRLRPQIGSLSRSPRTGRRRRKEGLLKLLLLLSRRTGSRNQSGHRSGIALLGGEPCPPAAQPA